jgi:uncharacterized protein (TIGR02594 family)
MSEPRWLIEARRHVGLSEIKGPTHAAEIVQFWKDIRRGGIKDDETPWCAAFVGAMLERSGVISARNEGARAYLTWGQRLAAPAVGAVAVLTRDGGGHVGFVVGKDLAGRILLLGGNQADAVNIKSFDPSRVAGYRWPALLPLPDMQVPVLAAVGKSTSEA